MLLPFIRKPAPAAEEGADEGGRKRRKKKRKGADDDSSDDNEPPPPLALDKLGPVRAHAPPHARTPHTRTCTCAARLQQGHGMRTCMVELPRALPQCAAPCP